MTLPTGTTFHMFRNGPMHRTRSADEQNVIDFSSFRQFEGKFQSRGFSIRYVTEGTELYKLNRKGYALHKGDYLLTNAFTCSDVVIDSTTDVQGSCMELSATLLAEVAGVLHEPGKPFPDRDFYKFLTSADFFEHSYKSGSTCLGRYLVANSNLREHVLADELQAGVFFYGIAEQVLFDQRELYGYFRSLDTVKMSTRKDLLYRLLKGKEMLDDCYTEKLSIYEVASAAAMSEYYFIRLFKKVFGCSPYAYVLNRRLQKAEEMLVSGNELLKNVAYKCGFGDLYSFSKAYKKKFGLSPSSVRLGLK